MAKTTKVTLDDVEFTVPALNIGQLQDVAELFATGSAQTNGFKILRIAMQRAEPKPDWDALAPTIDQIGAAVEIILVQSGLSKPNPRLAVVGGTEKSS